MLAIMLRIRQPEKKLNILIGNLNEASGRRKVCVCECLLTLRYYVLLFSLRLYNVVKMHNNNKSRRRRRSRGGGKKNNANKQKVAKVHNGKIETEIMKIA